MEICHRLVVIGLEDYHEVAHASCIKWGVAYKWKQRFWYLVWIVWWAYVVSLEELKFVIRMALDLPTIYLNEQNTAVSEGSISGDKINLVALGVNNGWFDSLI